MISTIGHMAAAGYDRSDTPYEPDTQYGTFIFSTIQNNEVPWDPLPRMDSTTLGPESDSRTVFGVGYVAMIPNDDTWSTITSMTIDGNVMNAQILAQISVPADASNDYAIVMVGFYGTVPKNYSGSEYTGKILISFGQNPNIGTGWFYASSIDFGSPAKGTFLTSDTTPSGSGQCSIDVPAHSAGCLLYLCEENLTNKSGITWIKNGTATLVDAADTSRSDALDTDETPYGYAWEHRLLNNAGACTVTATPDAWNAAEAACLVGITVHYT